MAKKAAPDKVTLLSQDMLRALDSLRQAGDGSYPPTLRTLAERSDGTFSEDQIAKAAGKKAFTARAVATEKVARKPSLDSPVYFTEDVPDPVTVLADRMLLVLKSQRDLGDDAYPMTLRRLAELCEVLASDKRVIKSASRMVDAETVVVAANSSGKTPSLDAPVVLKADVDGGIGPVVASLLRFALTPGPHKGKPKETDAFTRKELLGRFVLGLKPPFEAALNEAIERRTLPTDVAWVVVKDEPLLFLVEKLRPSAPLRSLPTDGRAAPPPVVPDVPRPATTPAASHLSPITTTRPARDFAEAFHRSFEALNHRNGSTNFVKLVDLRRELAEFDRDEFDAGLRQLVSDGKFSLDSHEGLHGPLTPEERDAGIRDSGSLLVYASRSLRR